MRRCISGRASLGAARRPTDPVPGAADPGAAAGGCAGAAGRDRAASRAGSRRARRAVPGGGPRGRRGARGPGATRPIRAGRGEPRFRGNVPATGVRREPRGDATRRGRAEWWRSGPGRGRFRPRYDGRCSTGTRHVASRAAMCGSGRDITCSTGRRAGLPRWRISSCSVGAIIGRCTRRAIRSSGAGRGAAVPAARWSAAARGAAARRGARGSRRGAADASRHEGP